MSEMIDDLTNLKLNSFLYFSQDHVLAMCGKLLFPDRIKAQEQGTVIKHTGGQLDNRERVMLIEC